MICQSCNGVVGRDCFNPEECMAITQDQAARYREQTQAESNCEQCEAALVQCRGEIQWLNERIEAMNSVFGKIRMGVTLPAGLASEVDSVMIREYRA